MRRIIRDLVYNCTVLTSNKDYGKLRIVKFRFSNKGIGKMIANQLGGYWYSIDGSRLTVFRDLHEFLRNQPTIIRKAVLVGGWQREDVKDEIRAWKRGE